MSHKNGGRMNRKERKFQKQRGKARAKRSSATLGGNARVSFPGIFVKGITMVHGLDIIMRMNAERPQVDKSLFALGEFHAACLTGDCDV